MTTSEVRVTPSLVRAVVVSMAFFGGLHVAVPEAASEVSDQGLVANHSAAAAPEGAPSCSEQCNRRASDCLDGCEERFKNDDKARVTCKFDCTNQRQKCEKDCE